MKIKNISAILLVTIVLVSCAPTTLPAITSTSTTSATATIEAPTKLPSSTPIPATETPAPTPTKEVKVYPPTNVTGTCTATFSMENLVKTDILLPNGVHLTRWMPCELPNGKTVAMAYTVQELETGYIFIAIGWEASSTSPNKLMPDGVYEGDNTWGLDDLNFKLLKSATINGKKVRFTFTTGNDSGAILEHDNPYQKVLVGELGNRMVAFAEPADDAQDDPSYLPTYPGIPYPIFFPYRLDNKIVLDE